MLNSILAVVSAKSSAVLNPSPSQSASSPSRVGGTTEFSLNRFLLGRHNSNDSWLYSLESKKTATLVDIYLLGITVVMGGQYFSWNNGLDEGVWCFLASTIFMGIGYICLTLCLAEMMSTLPFTGGLYGFVRVALNPFSGYIVAVCEVLQNVFYIAATMISFGEMIAEAMDSSKGSYLVSWLGFFVVSSVIHIMGGAVVVKATNLFALYVMIMIIIYLMMSVNSGDFTKYAEQKTNFEVEEVFERFNLAAWFYLGIETLPLSGIYCQKPRQDVPRAMVYCILTLFVTAVCIALAAASNEPGSAELVGQLMPFNHVFSTNFHVEHLQAAWFTIPAVFTTAFGFTFALSRQLHSMAQSGMLPAIFKEKTQTSGSPYVAVMAGSLISLLVCIPVGYAYTSFKDDLFNWCMISSYVCYVSTFISFVELRRKYAVVGRYFVNPLGIPSAIVGFVIFTMNFITTIAFQGEGKPIQHRIHPIGGFGVFMFFALVWYFVYARKYQCFSGEEQKIMFSAYVIKSNMKNKQNRKKMNKGRPGSRGSAAIKKALSASALAMTLVASHQHQSQTMSVTNSRRSSSVRSSSEGSGNNENNTGNGGSTTGTATGEHSYNRRKPGDSGTTAATTATGSEVDIEQGLEHSSRNCTGENNGADSGIESDSLVRSKKKKKPHSKRTAPGNAVGTDVIPEDKEVVMEGTELGGADNYPIRSLKKKPSPPMLLDTSSTKARSGGGDRVYEFDGDGTDAGDNHTEAGDIFQEDGQIMYVQDSTIEGLRALSAIVQKISVQTQVKIRAAAATGSSGPLPYYSKAGVVVPHAPGGASPKSAWASIRRANAGKDHHVDAIEDGVKSMFEERRRKQQARPPRPIQVQNNPSPFGSQTVLQDLSNGNISSSSSSAGAMLGNMDYHVSSLSLPPVNSLSISSKSDDSPAGTPGLLVGYHPTGIAGRNSGGNSRHGSFFQSISSKSTKIHQAIIAVAGTVGIPTVGSGDSNHGGSSTLQTSTRSGSAGGVGIGPLEDGSGRVGHGPGNMSMLNVRISSNFNMLDNSRTMGVDESLQHSFHRQMSDIPQSDSPAQFNSNSISTNSSSRAGSAPGGPRRRMDEYNDIDPQYFNASNSISSLTRDDPEAYLSQEEDNEHADLRFQHSNLGELESVGDMSFGGPF